MINALDAINARDVIDISRGPTDDKLQAVRAVRERASPATVQPPSPAAVPQFRLLRDALLSEPHVRGTPRQRLFV